MNLKLSINNPSNIENRSRGLYDSFMSLNQLGMIFQIAGFVLAAVFAGILLERGVLSIWRGKGEAWFAFMTSALERVTFTLGRTQTGGIAIQIPGEQRLSSIRVKSFGGMLLYAIIFASPAVGAGCIIAGHLAELTWLFWTGVSFLSLFALAILGEILNNLRHANTQVDLKRNTPQESKTDNQIEIRSPEEESLSRSKLPVLLLPLFIPVLALMLMLFSVLAIPLCLFLGVLRGGQLVVALLKGKDSIKRALIIIGTVMLLVGLILEFVASL